MSEPVTRDAHGSWPARYLRREDQRLLEGRGRHLASILVDGMLNCVFVRSTTAHGTLQAIDLDPVLSAAELVVRGPSGTRVVPASDFFIGWFQTALAEDEVLTKIRVPKLDESWGFDYQKFTVSEQGWAIVGARALVRREGDRITDARISLTNMAPAPVRARETERLLLGARINEDVLAQAAEAAPAGTEPGSDLTADADYRRHLAQVLTKRALDRSLTIPSNHPI
ncbi:MAG: FAD binding domain-containing protein [Trebonia sp.]